MQVENPITIKRFTLNECFLHIAKVEIFFNELRNILEFEGPRFHSVSSLGTVSILERAIIEVLRKRFGVEFDEKGPIVFSEWLEKVREAYALKLSKVKILEKRR